ncbi:MAG: hypothetical protein HZB35_02950 [Nitrospirae bacterium]|nr:hypothetical protein [Nitrospirota bacterium]
MAGVVLCLVPTLLGAIQEQPPTLPIQDPQTLREVTRTLEEELKLASRPQPYLVLDLSQRVMLIKGRGVILRHFTVLDWKASRDATGPGVYKLRARPPVARPKIQPGQDSTEHPIEVHDMPMEYLLVFDRDLVIEVAPPLAERPWHWFKRKWLSHWIRVRSWVRADPAGEFLALPPRLSLIVPHEEAQALAWAVTEGMPLLIGRTDLP